MSWHERTQHVSRAEPSAPGKLINKQCVEHFLYNQRKQVIVQPDLCEVNLEELK